MFGVNDDTQSDFEQDEIVRGLLRDGHGVRSTEGVLEVLHTSGVALGRRTWEVTGLLWELHDRRVHEAAGYRENESGFLDWVVSLRVPNLPGPRQLRFYMRAYRYFRLSGVTIADLDGIIVTNTRFILQIPQADFMADRENWLHHMREDGRLRFEARVFEYLGVPLHPRLRGHLPDHHRPSCVTLSIPADELERFYAAVNAGKEYIFEEGGDTFSAAIRYLVYRGSSVLLGDSDHGGGAEAA